MSAPDDDTLRAMLAARTPGEWRVSSYFADDPPEVWARREGESEMVACIDSPIDQKPGPAATANADLCAAAPALAAEVLRLRGEIERRDAEYTERECREIERHQRMCAALDIPEEHRAYATDAEVEAAATDAVCERDALASEVIDLRTRADDAEAARDALRAAVREVFDADAAVEEAAEAATHAWGRATGPALDALNTVSERRAAAWTRLRDLAGEGGR